MRVSEEYLRKRYGNAMGTAMHDCACLVVDYARDDVISTIAKRVRAMLSYPFAISGRDMKSISVLVFGIAEKFNEEYKGEDISRYCIRRINLKKPIAVDNIKFKRVRNASTTTS